MNDNKNTDCLIRTENISKFFEQKTGLFNSKKEIVRAVENINIHILKGETVGLVGESGCGKTTLGRTILRLIDPTNGNIFFDGNNITSISGKELRKLRRNMQIIFQDPYSSLNPRFKVKHIIAEGLYNFKNELKLDNISIDKIVSEILEKTGLSKDASTKYPHQFSGGQRQRIGIGRAIALNPKFIVCDEPLSALDVSIKSQILNLLHELKKEYKLSYLFISHDLKITASISDRIYIMYLGRIIEELPSSQLFKNPFHPYTKALISAVPEIDSDKRRKRILLEGDVPSPVSIPSGCPFHPRCLKAMEICKSKTPKYLKKGDNHFVACWLYDQNSDSRHKTQDSSKS